MRQGLSVTAFAVTVSPSGDRGCALADTPPEPIDTGDAGRLAGSRNPRWYSRPTGAGQGVEGRCRHGDRRRSTIRIISSTSSALRLRAATAFLHDSPPTQDVLLVASSRGAADDWRGTPRPGAAPASGGTASACFNSPLGSASTPWRRRAACQGRRWEPKPWRRAPSSGPLPVAACAISARRSDPGVPARCRAHDRRVASGWCFGGEVAEKGPGGPDLATLLGGIDRELAGAGAADKTLLLDLGD